MLQRWPCMDFNAASWLSLQGDASNVTILGLLMESTLPKNYVGHPQVTQGAVAQNQKQVSGVLCPYAEIILLLGAASVSFVMLDGLFMGPTAA